MTGNLNVDNTSRYSPLLDTGPVRKSSSADAVVGYLYNNALGRERSTSGLSEHSVVVLDIHERDDFAMAELEDTISTLLPQQEQTFAGDISREIVKDLNPEERLKCLKWLGEHIEHSYAVDFKSLIAVKQMGRLAECLDKNWSWHEVHKEVLSQRLGVPTGKFGLECMQCLNQVLNILEDETHDAEVRGWVKSFMSNPDVEIDSLVLLDCMEYIGKYTSIYPLMKSMVDPTGNMDWNWINKNPDIHIASAPEFSGIDTQLKMKIISLKDPQLLKDFATTLNNIPDAKYKEEVVKFIGDNVNTNFMENVVPVIAKDRGFMSRCAPFLQIENVEMRSAAIAFVATFDLEVDFKQVAAILNRMGSSSRLVPFVFLTPTELLPYIEKANVNDPQSIFNTEQRAIFDKHLDALDKKMNGKVFNVFYETYRDNEVGKKVLDAAVDFLSKSDRFQWIPSGELFKVTHEKKGWINNFITYFKYAEGVVPKEIEETTKTQMQFLLNDKTIAPEGKMQMNCWEFVTLTLVRAGIVKQEDIKELYHYKNLGKEHLVMQAMLGGLPQQSYKRFSEEATKPGDVLIYYIPGEKIQHAAIYEGEGKAIELLDDTVRSTQHDNWGSKYAHIHVVPAEQLARNVDRFVRSRQHLGDAHLETYENERAGGFTELNYTVIKKK